MDVLAPWSLASYLPYNGFHPLYRSLVRTDSADTRLFTPRKPGYDQFRSLIAAAGDPHKVDVASPDWVSSADGNLLFQEFVATHCTADIWLQSQLSGDVELHHSVPVTRGDRPFVLHCEEFLPLFRPFFPSGVAVGRSRIETIRSFYRDIFESSNCLAIISHMPQTLDQLSGFLQSSVVDGKLTNVPIGLDPSYIAKASAKSTELTKFAFLRSAHQDSLSFSRRGGMAAIRLAIELLRQRSDLSFYFVDLRPTEHDLGANGIDVAELVHYESRHITWIEQQLPDQMRSRLLAQCHFLLQPGVELDSVAVMSAMANGTVPIATDVAGIELYVDNMVNGVVLNGFRPATRSPDVEQGMADAAYVPPPDYESALTASFATRVLELLANKDKTQEMAEAGKRTMRQRFDGPTFAHTMFDEIRRRWANAAGNTRWQEPSRQALGERFIEDVSPLHFSGPPRPTAIVGLANGTVHRKGRDFVFVPSTLMPEFASDERCWSLLRLANDAFNLTVPRNARTIGADSLQRCIALTRFTRTIDLLPSHIGTAQRSLASLNERIWFALLPHPRTLRAARAVYRLLRRYGLLR